MNQSKIDRIFESFLSHYNLCKNDPESMIMRRTGYKLIKSPLFVSWEITSECNLSCVHCRAANNISRSDIVNHSWEEYKKIISYFRDAEIFRLGITGGEPFTHPLLFDILKEVKKHNIQIILYTNGTLLNEKICDSLNMLLDEYDIIHFSLDGGNAESNDHQRGRGSFDKAISGLEILSKTDINVRLNVVPTMCNIDSIEELARLAVRYNVKEFGASPLMTAGRAIDSSKLEVETETLFEIELSVEDILKNTTVQYIGGISGTVHNYLELPQLVSNITKIKRKPVDKKICDAGTRKMFIDANGDVYPCSLFASSKEFCQGNIFEESLNSIWKRSSWKIFRVGIDVDNHCSECALSCLCNGGCPALTYLHTGDLSGIDPRCKINKI